MTITRMTPKSNPFDAAEVAPDQGRMMMTVVAETASLETAILATKTLATKTLATKTLEIKTLEIKTETRVTVIPDPRVAPGAEEVEIGIEIRMVMVKRLVSDTTCRPGSIPLSCW